MQILQGEKSHQTLLVLKDELEHIKILKSLFKWTAIHELGSSNGKWFRALPKEQVVRF
jgi:hypothetical protein